MSSGGSETAARWEKQERRPPPRKDGVQFLPYRNPHLRNSGKAYLGPSPMRLGCTLRGEILEGDLPNRTSGITP